MKTCIVYLLHFDRPFRHAKHYLGSTVDLDARLACHRSNHSDVRLLRIIKAAGIGFQLARTWKGDKKRERKMKGRGLSALCPICKQQPKEEKQ